MQAKFWIWTSLALALVMVYEARPAHSAEESLMAVARQQAAVEPKLVSRTGFKIIGIRVRTTNQAEADPKTAKIPGLWNQFYREGVLDKIPNKTGGSVFGVYTNYESDHSGAYDLIVSAEVTSLDNVPSGMIGAEIPSGKYLVFPAKGQMPDAIIRTWADIWSFFSKPVQYERAYASDFELSKGPAETDIYISIK